MDQKEEEYLVFDYFRNHFPGFPKGRLIPSESPDFILKENSKSSIGFELTQLVQKDYNLVAAIKTVLEKKEEKLKRYRKRWFRSVWLIIYADFIETKGNYHLENKISNLRFETGFDRVILFDLFEKKHYILNSGD